MDDLARIAVREPGTDTPEQYSRRVYQLAATYVALFSLAVIGIVLLVWQGQFFVALSQRSNVETLVLAFILVLFAYVAFLSAPGAVGALRIGWYALQARLTGNREQVERRKAAALGPPGQSRTTIALNVALERESLPNQAFALAVADKAGSLGLVRVDGARLTHIPMHGAGSNDLLAYTVHQISALVRERGVEREIDIVLWKRIDDEQTEQFLSLVEFARNLKRQLDAPELWPTVTLTAGECAELERRLAAICPALRNEAFLPDWEYQGEHKVPIIPEPLGFLILSRSERRVDPVASMGCAALVVLGLVAILALFIIFPPWVPGT
jgi:hypothetical protein